ncbi:TetR family transcriptional regulator C-terminal domain-containing protein [Arthrobacter sp. ISL-65]|uniref:TetR family transcriptional regulator C-terminal domain-containing protein n=1 Tax=Arthrobacter sp. ISL-65 TaxID=2819112 RepID=UPI002034E7DE|nr:TetR family transcriptional regulator C-terminal domain-containing protein [Arthrobacter sp. ISL-65]
MAARIDALPAQEDARATLYDVAEQALPLDDERALEAVVWSYFLLSNRHDPELLREHTISHASWIDRLTALARTAYGAGPAAGEMEQRVRALVACLDGLALNAVTDPAAYPSELQRCILRTQLDLMLERKPTP